MHLPCTSRYISRVLQILLLSVLLSRSSFTAFQGVQQISMFADEGVNLSKCFMRNSISTSFRLFLRSIGTAGNDPGNRISGIVQRLPQPLDLVKGGQNTRERIVCLPPTSSEIAFPPCYFF